MLLEDGETLTRGFKNLEMLLQDDETRQGVYLTKFNTGRLHPEAQPLTLLYTILAEKRTRFIHLSLKKGTPYTYLPVTTSYE